MHIFYAKNSIILSITYLNNAFYFVTFSIDCSKMETQDIVIVHPKTEEEVNVLKTIMKSLNIKFEIFLRNMRKQFEEHKIAGPKDK